MTNRKEYIRNYMRRYRKGLKRKDDKRSTLEQIREDRLKGDDIFILSLRYGYSVVHIWRLTKDLNMPKHVNRGKLRMDFCTIQRAGKACNER